MSGPTVETRDGEPVDAQRLIARAATASARARDRRAAEVRDLLSNGDARLDDRTRAAAASCLDAIVRALDARVRGRAAAELRGMGAEGVADRLDALDIDMVGILAGAGVLSDAALIEEILGRVGESLLAERMPADTAGEGDEPGILLRLAEARDADVARAARACLAAEASRRAEMAGLASAGDLPAPCRARLCWPIVAVLRARLDGGAAADEALATAARETSAPAEDDSPEAGAMRLAAALSPDAEERALLIADALADRRPGVATALVADALGADYAAVREMVLDPEGDRLWLALRAVGLDRRTIARFGYALGEADPRRRIDALADALDAVMAIPVEQARDAVAAMCLPREFREALTLLERRGAA